MSFAAPLLMLILAPAIAMASPDVDWLDAKGCKKAVQATFEENMNMQPEPKGDPFIEYGWSEAMSYAMASCDSRVDAAQTMSNNLAYTPLVVGTPSLPADRSYYAEWTGTDYLTASYSTDSPVKANRNLMNADVCSDTCKAACIGGTVGAVAGCAIIGFIPLIGPALALGCAGAAASAGSFCTLAGCEACKIG
jgi:hypothetical protein